MEYVKLKNTDLSVSRIVNTGAIVLGDPTGLEIWIKLRK